MTPNPLKYLFLFERSEAISMLKNSVEHSFVFFMSLIVVLEISVETRLCLLHIISKGVSRKIPYFYE